MRVAIINTNTNIVEYVLIYDDDAPIASPPEGFSADYIGIADAQANVGWTWDGARISAPPPVVLPQTVPDAVSPKQARIALLNAGLLDQVQAAVDAAGGATKIAWEYATEIRRNDPLIETLAQELPLTAAQVDQIFTAAYSIP